jgi:hypothetical protein
MTELVLNIPTGSGNSSQQFKPPTGIPQELSGGLNTSGSSLAQVAYNWVFMIAIFLAAAVIIFSGIQLITSQGDPQKVSAARSRLIYGIIGLVVVSGAFFIVSTIITVSGGNPQPFFKFN